MDLDIKIRPRELFASGSRSLRNWKRLEQQHLALARRLSISTSSWMRSTQCRWSMPQDVALNGWKVFVTCGFAGGAGCKRPFGVQDACRHLSLSEMKSEYITTA